MSYEWVRESDALCVAVVAGRTEDEVIDGYGGEPAEALPARFDDLGDMDGVLLVRSVGDQVLAVEDNGWQGSRTEVQREVTTGGGRMVVAFWNVEADSRFSLAARGETLVGFEGLFPGQRDGTAPDRLIAEMRRVGYPEPVLAGTAAGDDDGDDGDTGDGDDGDWKARMLALVEAVTGVAVTADLLSGPARAVRLAPLPDDLPTRDMLAYAFVRQQDPELAAALDAAPDARLRAAAVAAARTAAVQAGVAGEPLLLAALDGPTGPVDRRSPLGRLLAGWAAAEHRSALDWAGGDPAATWRALAGEAVRAALAEDPLVAAYQAADRARVYLPPGAPARAAMLAALS